MKFKLYHVSFLSQNTELQGSSVPKHIILKPGITKSIVTQIFRKITSVSPVGYNESRVTKARRSIKKQHGT